MANYNYKVNQSLCNTSFCILSNNILLNSSGDIFNKSDVYMFSRCLPMCNTEQSWRDNFNHKKFMKLSTNHCVDYKCRRQYGSLLAVWVCLGGSVPKTLLSVRCLPPSLGRKCLSSLFAGQCAIIGYLYIVIEIAVFKIWLICQKFHIEEEK